MGDAAPAGETRRRLVRFISARPGSIPLDLQRLRPRGAAMRNTESPEWARRPTGRWGGRRGLPSSKEAHFMFHPTRKSLWTQALVLALAVALVASPAMARSRKGHGRHRGNHHGQEWRQGGGHHRHHGGCGHGRPVYNFYEDDDDDAGDVFLALGLGAVGLTALALFA